MLCGLGGGEGREVEAQNRSRKRREKVASERWRFMEHLAAESEMPRPHSAGSGARDWLRRWRIADFELTVVISNRGKDGKRRAGLESEATKRVRRRRRRSLGS